MKSESPLFMNYIIPTTPVAWKRAGVCGKKFYDQQISEKADYAVIIQYQHQTKPLFSGPLELIVTFHMPIAASINKKARLNIEGSWHRYTPDLDNCLKFLLDTCTGILFDDDAIIASVIAKKVYSCNPRTEFSISTLE